MSKIMLIAVILIPVLTGVLVPVIPFRKRRHMEIFLEAGVVFNTLLVWSLLGHRPTDSFILAKFTGDLAIAFRVDGMGMVFAGLVSFLWPLATLFSFEYMTKEKHEVINVAICKSMKKYFLCFIRLLTELRWALRWRIIFLRCISFTSFSL